MQWLWVCTTRNFAAHISPLRNRRDDSCTPPIRYDGCTSSVHSNSQLRCCAAAGGGLLYSSSLHRFVFSRVGADCTMTDTEKPKIDWKDKLIGNYDFAWLCKVRGAVVVRRADLTSGAQIRRLTFRKHCPTPGLHALANSEYHQITWFSPGRAAGGSLAGMWLGSNHRVGCGGSARLQLVHERHAVLLATTAVAKAHQLHVLGTASPRLSTSAEPDLICHTARLLRRHSLRPAQQPSAWSYDALLRLRACVPIAAHHAKVPIGDTRHACSPSGPSARSAMAARRRRSSPSTLSPVRPPPPARSSPPPQCCSRPPADPPRAAAGILVAILMGLQHALAMIGGLITPPLLVYRTTIPDEEKDPDLEQYFISAALIVSGITSLVQVTRFGVRAPACWHSERIFLGTGLISLMGTSFTFLPIFQTSIRTIIAGARMCHPGVRLRAVVVVLMQCALLVQTTIRFARRTASCWAR